jgi:hypothetical protein
VIDYLDAMARNREGGATHAAAPGKKVRKKASRPAQKKKSQVARKGLTRKKKSASMTMQARKRARSKRTAPTAEVTSMARKKKSAKRYGRFSAKEEEAKTKKKRSGGKKKTAKKKTAKKKKAKSTKRAKSKKTGTKKKRKSGKKKKAKSTKKKSTARKSGKRKTAKKKKAKSRKKKAAAPKKKRKKAKSKSPKKRKKAKSKSRKSSSKKKRKSGKKKKAKSKGGKRRASKQRQAVIRIPGKTEIIRIPGKTEIIRVPVRSAAEGTKRKKGKGKKRKGSRRTTETMPVVYESGGVMENPLSGVEWVVVAITGVAGFGTMDLIDRILATHALVEPLHPGTDPDSGKLWGDLPPTTGSYAGLYNATAVLAPMDWKRWLAGIGVTATPIIVANFISAPIGRSAFQLFGIGAGLRFAGKAFQDFMAWALKKTGFGQRIFDGEMRAAALRGSKGDHVTMKGSFPISGLGAAEEQLPAPDGVGAPTNGYPGGAPENTGIAGAPCGTCINCRTGVGSCCCPCQAGGGGGGGGQHPSSGPSTGPMNPPSGPPRGGPMNPPSGPPRGEPTNPSGPPRGEPTNPAGPPRGGPTNPAGPTACPPGMVRNADNVCVPAVVKQPPGPSALSALALAGARGTGAPQEGVGAPPRRFGLYRHSLPRDDE